MRGNAKRDGRPLGESKHRSPFAVCGPKFTKLSVYVPDFRLTMLRCVSEIVAIKSLSCQKSRRDFVVFGSDLGDQAAKMKKKKERTKT